MVLLCSVVWSVQCIHAFLPVLHSQQPGMENSCRQYGVPIPTQWHQCCQHGGPQLISFPYFSGNWSGQVKWSIAQFGDCYSAKLKVLFVNTNLMTWRASCKCSFIWWTGDPSWWWLATQYWMATELRLTDQTSNKQFLLATVRFGSCCHCKW